MNAIKAESRDLTRTTLAVLFIGMLIAAVFWVLSPFLISMVWAGMIVVATWPVMLGIQGRLWGKRGPAVAVMVVMLLLVIVVPFSLVFSAIAGRAADISSRVSSLAALTVPQPPAWVSGIPLAGPELEGRWQQLSSLSHEELAAFLTPYAKQAAGWFLARAGSLGMMLLYFLLTVIISGIFYSSGEKIAGMVLGFFRRLAGQQGEKTVMLAAKAIKGVALGIVITAVIQTAVAGIGLVITGVPAAALLTGVVFMLCLAQVGPALVLIPAVIWVYSNDGPLWGTLLLAVTFVALTMDNILRPVLIKKGVDLSLPLIFAGVVGGLLAFGIIGLFIGPVLLAVAITLLEAWIAEGKPQEAAVSDRE